jgi:hypothetical protein
MHQPQSASITAISIFTYFLLQVIYMILRLIKIAEIGIRNSMELNYQYNNNI